MEIRVTPVETVALVRSGEPVSDVYFFPEKYVRHYC